MSVYIYVFNHGRPIGDMINILLVDDDESFLELGKEFIAEDGRNDVITANSVRNALAILDTVPIGVIVSDYQMPEYDGIEFLRIVRKRNDRIPFILFTGMGREEVVIDAINEGVDFYIKKDTDIRSQYAQLIHTIDQAYIRKQAEDAVEYNLNLFKELIENSMDIIVVVDENGTIEYVSPSVNRILGYHEEEIIGHDKFMNLRPEVQELIQKQGINNLVSFESHFSRLETRKKDGTWATVEYITKSFERGGQKKIIFNFRDITERVEKDRQMLMMMGAIETQHDRVRTESENGLVGAITYDLQTGKASMTPMAAKIFGLDEGSREADVQNLENLVHPDDRNVFRNAVINESQTLDPVETKFRIILLRGEMRNINIISCTMLDKNDVPTHVHSVIRDCTEMVQLQEKIMAANMMK
jgi:PAS domain S-box-containing protein